MGRAPLNLVCVALAFALYALVFVPLYEVLGDVTGALAVLPIALAGALGGVRVGVAAGALSLPLAFVLYSLVGHAADEFLRAGVPATAVFTLVGGGVGRMRDLQRRMAAQADALRESEARLSLSFHHSPAALAVYSLDTRRFVEANESWLALSGHRADDIVGRTAAELGLSMPDADRRELRRLLDERGSVRDWEFTVHRADGGTRDALGSFEARRVQGERRLLISVIDITEHKRAERALRHQALHDSLTALPNRVLLLERLAREVERACADGTTVALLVMDLDRFKDVNDTFGHHAGDALLRDVGARLRQRLRSTDTVARLGGDEFAVVLPAAALPGAQRIARGILEALAEPFTVEGQALRLDASIGIALCPDHGEDAETLLRHADVALYVAKRTGSTFEEYAADLDDHTPERLGLLGELTAAIERDELVLHYQPVMDVRAGEFVAVEALVRWRHPVRGMLAPLEFLPLAERSGLMRRLSAWILERALLQCGAWRERGLDLRVAVNLSTRNLVDPDLPEIVGRLLERAALAPAALALEITESVLMSDPRRALENVAQLRRLGVRLSIDDFGTGYSSLAYLQELAVHEVKIDRSFVRRMAEDEGSAAIVRATVELGHHLGFEVVAEGVEDQRTYDLLAAIGCDLVQGFHVGRPLPADEAVRDLSAARKLVRGFKVIRTA